MTKFIPFTKEQLMMANAVDLVELLRNQGEVLEKSGKMWRWKRCTSVIIQGNKWYQHKYTVGGYSIKFLERFYNMDFPEAVQALLALNNSEITVSNHVEEAPKKFYVPKKNDNMRHLYGYLLKTRFINPDIVNAFVKQELIYEDKYHNIIFAGYDEKGVMKHAQRKGTANGFGRNVSGCNAAYSFHFIGASEKVFVFEAPIDLLSYISLHPEKWWEHTYITNCGLSTIPLYHHIENHANISEVNLCFDCDSAGDEATWKFKDELEAKGFSVKSLKSDFNDWNEDLKSLNGIDPKPAVINPKYEAYEAILNKVELLYAIQNKDSIDFQSLMQSYSNLLSKMEDETDVTESLQAFFEDLACKAYILFERTFTSNINTSNETKADEIKDYMYAHYRTYKDKNNLKVKAKEIKMIMNDLKLYYHKHSGEYLSAEITSKYQELAEECTMASRFILTESQYAPNERLTIKIPTQDVGTSNYELVMK